MPLDASTAVLIDEKGRHVKSTAVLRLFLYMGPLYRLLGLMALAVPRFLRDGAYRAFAANRGKIWKATKSIVGTGADTSLEQYRKSMIGLEDPIDSNWGFNTKRS